MWRNLSDWWFFLQSFFPVRLFILHLRRSYLLLIFWLVLLAFITGNLGSSYGFHYLFLTPEYLGETGFLSYFLVGITAGLFTMAFHVNSYIYYSYRYPFMATLSRPLWKFSINNSVIPLLFFGAYFYAIAHFSWHEGLPIGQILKHLSALILGLAITISLTFSYFLATIRSLQDPDEGKSVRGSAVETLRGLIKIGRKRQQMTTSSRVNYYLRNPLRIKLTRPVLHYDLSKMMATIEKHHLSAFMYFLLLISLVLLLGVFGGDKVFEIPAGASVFLIFSLYVMIVGAVYVRLKTWTISLGLVLILFINYLSGFDVFRRISQAYGMDYSTAPAQYSTAMLDSLTTDSILQGDYQEGLAVLKAWRARFAPTDTPQLLIVNLSGGGLRSTVFSLRVLAKLDSLSEGRFFNHLHLFCGSSGGMLAAAYYRELKVQERQGKIDRAWREEYIEGASRDLLNPVTFSMAVNDLFIRRLKQVKYKGRSYPFNRGYAFDQRWLENTDYLLDNSFGHYRSAELSAELPTLILSPTIVGDGRKLLISNRGLSYLSFSRPLPGVGRSREYDGVEFMRLFHNQDAQSLRMATALRMSASFPYITPLVHLPSEPGIELIDAGVRDNEGLELALRYLLPFKDWIYQNTAGVKIIQIKADRVDGIDMKEGLRSRLGELIVPVAGVVRSFANLQIYNKALLMELSEYFFDFPLSLHRVSLLEEEEKVSLSWHLTQAEKKQIKASLERPANHQALSAIVQSCKEKKPAASE